MNRIRFAAVELAIALVCLTAATPTAQSDEPAPPDAAAPAAVAPLPAPPPQPTEPAAGVPETAGDATPLSMKQDAVAQRYRRFEKTLRQMAEYMRKTDPDRANLLYRVSNQSSQDRIGPRLDEIVALLAAEHPQFGEAVERQEDVSQFLQALLRLLQSEDRKADVEQEKKRLEQIQQEVNRLIAREKAIRNKTDRRPGDAENIADEQRKIADDTGQLGEKIDRQDLEKRGEAGKGEKGKKSKGDGKKADGDSKEGENGEGQPDSGNSDGKPSDSGKPGEKDPGEKPPGEKKSDEKKSDEDKSSENKSDEGKQSEPDSSEGKSGEGKSQEGKSQEGKSGEGKSGEGKSGEGKSGEQQSPPPGEDEPSEQQSERTPGREEIEKARQEMEEAIEKLKSRKLDDASAHQDEALKQLIAAKEKLEEILRQLREEERELMLAALEARFQKMLAMQILVNASTIDVSKVPKPEWTSQQFGRTRELSGQEDEIAVEAAKALNLLKEEGSSVAFPEAVTQIHQDMITVARRLERSDVAELTQGIEQDIVESLQEIVEALRKEMEKLKEQKSQQQKKQQQQQGDQSLVDELAELKMLRSLQHRINRRTKQLGVLTKGEQATDQDAVTQLQQLSQRQARVQEATYDLSTGKNE